jgi:uncharacterized HhH-GPD family protein
MDYTTLNGGLARMLDRLTDEGTATEVPEADELLREDGNAVLLGLLYDQRIRAEMAFTGPYKLKQRLGHLDMGKIASMPFETFQEHFAKSPAVHRFTNSMAERTQKVADLIATEYAGDASRIWADGNDLAAIEKRVKALPGFGPSKTKKIKYCLHYFGHRDFSDHDAA